MFWKMIGRWVVAAVAIPLAAAGARRLGQTIETRRGPSRATGALRKSADLLQRVGGRPTRRRRFF